MPKDLVNVGLSFFEVPINVLHGTQRFPQYRRATRVCCLPAASGATPLLEERAMAAYRPFCHPDESEEEVQSGRISLLGSTLPQDSVCWGDPPGRAYVCRNHCGGGSKP